MNSEKYARLLVRMKEKATEFKNAVSLEFAAAQERDGTVQAALTSSATLIRIAMPVIHMMASFMFAGTSITLGAYPFGIAFFAACGRSMPWAYAGAILRIITDGRDVLINAAAYTLLLVLRLLSRVLSADAGRKKEDSIRIRMAISIIGAASLGAYSVIANAFSLPSLGGFVLMCALCPALTFLYYGTLTEKRETFLHLYREAGMGAIAVSLVFALRGIAPLTIDLSVLLAFVLTQYVTVKRGWIKGAVLGLFMGLALPVTIVPIYFLAAVASGFLYRGSPYIALSAAVMAALSWTVYAGGYKIVLSYSAEIIIGGIITASLFASDVIAVEDKPKDPDTIPHEVLLAAEQGKNTSVREQITSEAEAFSGMSDMLFRLSDKVRRPSMYDIREVAEAESSALCRRCKSRERCWVENESVLSDAVSKLVSTLHSSGVINKEDIPDELMRHCSQPEAVTERMNQGYAKLLEDLIERDKTEVMAFDYSAMSAVLRDVIAQRDGEYEINASLYSKLSALLRENKINARRVCIFGERRKTVFISDIKLSGLHIGEDDLRRLASRACGGTFSTPSFELSGSLVNATLTNDVSYSVNFERVQSKKDESAANGDVAVGFECRDDRYCALLSDGMGSGREAALTSGMCALFIEKMMTAGNSASVTLKMLNCFLRARGSECSATVDLFDFDLITGKARFIKSGAAPSYVVRGTNVYKISSHTIPVGIMRALDAEETSIELCTDDIVVLVSDGITKCDEDCAWLYSMLVMSADRPIADTAAAIIREAERRSGRDDDATVCIVRITAPRSTTVQ